MQEPTDAELQKMPTPELVRRILEESRLLVRAEVLHAKLELKQELKQAKRTGILVGAAAVLGLCALAALFVAAGLALPLAAALGVLVVGLGLLLAAGGLGLLGYRSLPKKVLNETTARLKQDVRLAKEQFA